MKIEARRRYIALIGEFQRLCGSGFAGIPYIAPGLPVDLHRELIDEGAPEDRDQFERMMLERLLTGFEDVSAGSEIVGSDNLDYFLDRLCSAA